MPAPAHHQELFEHALDVAVTKHFANLFEVLLAAPSNDADAAMTRFKAGLARLAETRDAVQQAISGAI